MGQVSDGSTAEYTGKDVSYYLVKIESPKRLEPYEAECEDIIEALGMTFAEGCAFKAIWRKCAARTLGVAKAGYKGGLYDAEKAQYYGARMVAAELRLEVLTHAAPHAQTVPSPRAADSMPAAFGQQDVFEPASEIDDESDRIQAIGQNGNSGEHYDQAEIDRKAADYEKLERWKGAPEWAKWLAQDRVGASWYEEEPVWSESMRWWEAPEGQELEIDLTGKVEHVEKLEPMKEPRPCAN
jgi:hypothetical protein